MVPAPAVVAHPAVVRAQKGQCEKVVMKVAGSGKGRLIALDHGGTWVLCQSSAPRAASAASTTQQQLQKSIAFRVKPTAVDEVASDDTARGDQSGCETPKSQRHRIPVVDVDQCPPAPKKPRASGRFAVLCASAERDGPSSPSLLHHNLGSFSPGYLF